MAGNQEYSRDVNRAEDQRDYLAMRGDFEVKSERKKFVGKVFSLTGLMLLPPFFMAFLPFMSDDIQEFFIYNWLVLILVGMLTYLVAVLVIACVPAARKTYPYNLILLVLMSVSISLVIAATSSRYKILVPGLALAITITVVYLVGLLAKFGPCDVTGCGMLLTLLSIILLLFGVIIMILQFVYPVPLLHVIYSGLSALLLMFYLWFDLQMIMGGRRHEMSADEIVLAVAILFSDIVMLFFHLINLIGNLF